MVVGDDGRADLLRDAIWAGPGLRLPPVVRVMIARLVACIRATLDIAGPAFVALTAVVLGAALAGVEFTPAFWSWWSS